MNIIESQKRSQQIKKHTKKRCISLTRRHHNQTPQGIEIRLRDAYFGGNDVAEGIANGEGNVGGHRQKGIHLDGKRERKSKRAAKIIVRGGGGKIC